MVDYDAAVAAVQDPNADPILLAKIAYENPEFGANVAVNPRCYPGLKRWIAEFGDDRARETLAQYGFTAEAFGGPVQDQKATAQAAQQPAAEQAQQPAAQAAFEEPVATNPYGFTAEQALTTTDQMQIAQIAQYAPELRACIARIPTPIRTDRMAGPARRPGNQRRSGFPSVKGRHHHGQTSLPSST